MPTLPYELATLTPKKLPLLIIEKGSFFTLFSVADVLVGSVPNQQTSNIISVIQFVPVISRCLARTFRRFCRLKRLAATIAGE